MFLERVQKARSDKSLTGDWHQTHLTPWHEQSKRFGVGTEGSERKYTNK